MRYEFKSEDAYALSYKLGAETHLNGNELFFKKCPYCNGGEHDKNTFSINLESGMFKCFRATCGKQGHFVEMARDFNFQLDYGKQNNYRALVQKEITVRDNAIEYLKSRGISEKITKQYKITTCTDNSNTLVFPFFDENGIMVFVKYRNIKFDKSKNRSKEWTESNTKPVLFGMMQCKDFDRLIITEGQIDSLSIAECGIDNAVSVPTGACGFTWVPHCWNWVNKFSEIIVFGDCEKNKITLVAEISKHFQNKRIKVVRECDYLGEKDANDILLKFGKEAIIECVKNAEIKPVQAVKKLSDVKSIDLDNLEHIKTGIYDIDRAIGGMYPGQIIVLTGKRGDGKSTLASQICANVLEQKYNLFIYSGELPDYHFKRWLDLQIAGSNNIITSKNEYGDETYSISNDIIEKINLWYNDKAYIFDNSVILNEVDKKEELSEKPITLLGTIEKAICQYGIKFILLDNLMTALDVDLSNDLYRAQSEFLKDLKIMAIKYEIVVLLIAHPKKTQQGQQLDNESISGSGDITNRVDLVMTYSKNTDTDAEEYQSKIAITKNRLTGRLLINEKSVKVKYSNKSKRIVCENDNSNKKYSFEISEIKEIEPPPF